MTAKTESKKTAPVVVPLPAGMEGIRPRHEDVDHGEPERLPEWVLGATVSGMLGRPFDGKYGVNRTIYDATLAIPGKPEHTDCVFYVPDCAGLKDIMAAPTGSQATFQYIGTKELEGNHTYHQFRVWCDAPEQAVADTSAGVQQALLSFLSQGQK